MVVDDYVVFDRNVLPEMLQQHVIVLYVAVELVVIVAKKLILNNYISNVDILISSELLQFSG